MRHESCSTRLRGSLSWATVTACSALLCACGGDGGPRQLECIAPANAGGGWDLSCRALATAYRELDLGPGNMRVRNVPGAGGGIVYTNFASQQSDNPAVLAAASPATVVAMAEGQYGDLTEDDVRWVAAVAAEPGLIAVETHAPWQTLGELVDAWRQDPSSIAVGGGSSMGGQDHMKALVLARTAGIPVRDVAYVPFDGGGEAVTALLGGFVQMVPAEGSEIRGQLEAGNVRILAVLSSERESGLLADVPTARELGYDAEWTVWRGFFAPRDISDAIYARWMAQLDSIAASGEWDGLLERYGWNPYFSSGRDFAAMVGRQAEDFRALTSELGLRP